MDSFQYLLQANENEVLNTWLSLGGMTCNNNTKMYTAGSVFRLDCSDGDGLSSAPLHNSIIYCIETYRVDNRILWPIDWSQMNIDDVKGIYSAIEGIQLPYFGILPGKWNASFLPDRDFLPYNNKEIGVDNGGITIEDDELEICLADIGFPFLNFTDVELTKNQITKFCVKPALQRYYNFRPIVIESPGGMYAQGNEFLIPFPEGAYACIPYYTTPGGAGAAASAGGPFSFYNEQIMTGSMGMGGRFGKGVRYHGKQVPGFVGLGQRNAQLDALAVNQGFLNFFRREKYSRKWIDGKLYAYGFSTVGGNLNFKWLCASYDWRDIRFEDLETIARPMVRSNVLNNFGMLRQLVKTDIAGQLDATVLTSQRDKLEENLKPILNSIGLTGMMAASRGGG
jgi:hypothetical protein